MGMASNVFLVVSVLIAWIAYFLISPVPVGFENPWKIRLFDALHKIQLLTADGADLMGVDHWINMTRNMINHPPELEAELLENVQSNDEVVDGVSVRIYKPRSHSPSGPLPVWVYYHGGSWALMNVDMYDAFCRRTVIGTGIAVVSVEYRLAPEHPYPAPLNDCHKATLYVLEHAVELGFDPLKVLIGGDSAGGNLAAAVAMRMNNSNPPLFAQILIYPVVQTFTLNFPSYFLPWTPLLLRSRFPPFSLMYFFGFYNSSWVDLMLEGSHLSKRVRERYSQYVDYRKLPEEFRHGYVEPKMDSVNEEVAQLLEPYVTNPEINPLLSADLTGLPETLVITAGYDILRDEGTLYAIRLREAGVKVEHLNYEQGFHGMTMITEEPFRFDVGVRSFDDICSFIRHRLAH